MAGYIAWTEMFLAWLRRTINSMLRSPPKEFQNFELVTMIIVAGLYQVRNNSLSINVNSSILIKTMNF